MMPEEREELRKEINKIPIHYNRLNMSDRLKENASYRKKILKIAISKIEEAKKTIEKLTQEEIMNTFKSMTSVEKIEYYGTLIGVEMNKLHKETNATESNLEVEGEPGTVKITFKSKQ
jgi:Tfp pilus assembly protein PilX